MSEDKAYQELTLKDERNYIDALQSRAEDYRGEKYTPQEMATEFAKLGIDDRVAALQSLSANAGELSVREAAHRYAYERELRNVDDLAVNRDRRPPFILRRFCLVADQPHVFLRRRCVRMSDGRAAACPEG